MRPGKCIPGQQTGSAKYSRQERVGMFKQLGQSSGQVGNLVGARAINPHKGWRFLF